MPTTTYKGVAFCELDHERMYRGDGRRRSRSAGQGYTSICGRFAEQEVLVRRSQPVIAAVDGLPQVLHQIVEVLQPDRHAHEAVLRRG